MIPFDNVVTAQLQHFSFGDQRLNQRCCQCIAQIDECGAHHSFPRIFKAPHQLKAFYRLMNHSGVTPEALLNSYRQGLIEQVSQTASKQGVPELYLFSDSTFCTYNERKKLQLGYLETPKGNGLLLHTGILATAQWTPLGVVAQEVIVRDKADFGKSRRRFSRPFEEKESFKWVQSIDWAQQLFEQTGVRAIQVMDREADIADLFNYALAKEQLFIIRAWHDRQVVGSSLKLWDYIGQQAPAKQLQRQLLDSKGKPHMVNCQLRYATVALPAITQSLQVVHLKALDTADIGLEETEWLLATNVPITQAEQAERCLDAYTHRWRICEDFHKCLKTGCSVQQRQFDSLKPLATVITLLSLTAIRLLRMRYLAQEQKDSPIGQVLNGPEIQLAEVLAQQYLTPTDLKHCQRSTVLWWVLLLGRLGGHQGYSQKGLPGWQTLFHGWNYFQALLKGINLSKNFFPNSGP